MKLSKEEKKLNKEIRKLNKKHHKELQKEIEKYGISQFRAIGHIPDDADRTKPVSGMATECRYSYATGVATDDIKQLKKQKAIEILKYLNKKFNEIDDYIFLVEMDNIWDCEFCKTLENISKKFRKCIDNKIKELEEE